MNFDVDKQIAYWRDGAQEDMGAACDLMEKRRYRHGMFFAHLALEKALKALVTRATRSHPPKTHNLATLVAKTDIEIDEPRRKFLRMFNAYQLEGRYPGAIPGALSPSILKRDFDEAQEILEWLTAQL